MSSHISSKNSSTSEATVVDRYNKDPPKVPQPIGHAYNVLGIPGDGSPPARFIRAFYMRGYSMLLSPPKDLNTTLILGQELLNAVYKPLGTIPRSSPTDPLETTPYLIHEILVTSSCL